LLPNSVTSLHQRAHADGKIRAQLLSVGGFKAARLRWDSYSSGAELQFSVRQNDYNR